MEVGEFGWGEERGSGGGHGLGRWMGGSVGFGGVEGIWEVALSPVEANIIPVLIMIYDV